VSDFRAIMALLFTVFSNVCLFVIAVQDENNPLPLGNNYLPRVNLGEDE
jgi:hypothetical protein